MKTKITFAAKMAFSSFLILYATNFNAQTRFQKTFGGSSTDYAYSMQQVDDGGYVIAGYTLSFGEGSRDIFLIRTDDQGATLWTKTYGNSNTDYAWTVDQTNNGDFIIGAHSESFGAGSHDINLIRTDAGGQVIWSRAYGGASADGAYSLMSTLDGGVVVASHTNTFGEGQHEYHLMKTDSTGNVLWTKTYGNAGGDFLRGLGETHDQGFIMTGETYSFGAGGADVYVVRTDMAGDTMWTRTYGGAGDDFGYSVHLTGDQAYIIAGHTRSFGAGQLDLFLMKIDDYGDVIWAKTYGGPDDDRGLSVDLTQDGGVIVSGRTKSFAMGGFCDILCDDIYLVRTDEAGDTLWTKVFGSLNDEQGWSVAAANDGGFAVAGITTGFGEGAEDVYFIKTDENGLAGCEEKGTQTEIGEPAFEVKLTSTIVGSGILIEDAFPVTGESQSVESTLCLTTSIESPDFIQDAFIYPNPANQTAYLSFSLNKAESLTINIYCLAGKLVNGIPHKEYESGITSLEVSFIGLNSGTYFLELASQKERVFRKLLVIK